MNIKACIFDLDGVIVDTARFHYIAWKALASELGFDFTEKDNERLKGVSRMDSLNILLDIGNITLNNEEKERYADEKNQRYLDYVNQMTKHDILPGVEKFLYQLKNRNILIGLGSASKNAGIILEQTGLQDVFDAIVDGTRVKLAKPDPQVFLLGAEMLHVLPEYCVVFEDAVAGVEAAHRAGMMCVGVGSNDTLSAADMVIPGFVGFSAEKMIFKNKI